MQIYQQTLFEHNPDLLEQLFLSTDLGGLYRVLPLDSIINAIQLPRYEVSGLGRPSRLTVRGGVCLMVLKHYLGISDEKLLNRMNTDWSMQYFCGFQLNAGEQIKDKNLVSTWRTYLGAHLDVKALQYIQAAAYKQHLTQTHICMMDATVFESYIAYPTDIKLLWRSCTEVYEWICKISKEQKLRKPRMNFASQREKYHNHQKSRKKSRKREKKLRRTLIKFLLRLLERLDYLQNKYQLRFNPKSLNRLSVVKEIFNQQQLRLLSLEQKIMDRIVSLHKPYLRPIVRGKEIKPVEFGAKVHMMQVDGVNFIERLSYDAFNESRRLQSSIFMHRKMFGKLRQLGADQIYATNENRKYCTKNGIATSFHPKGKQKFTDQMTILKKEIGTARSTRMEGSFGNEKNHYALQKIKARNQTTETAWIMFGVFTANIVAMSKRIKQSKPKAA